MGYYFPALLLCIASFLVGALAYRRYRFVHRYFGNLERFLVDSFRIAKLRWERWWSPPVVLEGYLRDDTIDYCVKSFELRARAWRIMAVASFLFSLASVIIGILIFVYADRIAVDNPELERLLNRRDELQATLDAGLSELDEGEREKVIAGSLYVDWQLLRKPVFRMAKAEYRSGDAEAARGARILLSLWQGEGKLIPEVLGELGLSGSHEEGALYSAQDVAEFAAFLEEHSLNSTELVEFLQQYLILLESEGLAEEEFIQELKAVSTRANQLLPQVEAVYSDLKQRLETAEANSQQNTVSDRISLRSTQSTLRNLNEQIGQIQAKFDPTNLYSVVPLLVVRLGAIILLIFLTQILLAAYRYNTMLCTHYAAIADALRLVRKESNSSTPDYVVFETLMKSLHAKETSYIPPESPVQYIAELRGKDK